MKKIFIAATALLFSTAVLHAQTKEGTKQGVKATHHKGAHGKNQMAGLNLNDEQKAKVKELNESYHKQFADLKKNTSISVGDYRTKSLALRKEQHEKMQALLTPEQKTQIAAQRKVMGEKMKEGQAKRFDKMKTQLGLSEEQSKKLKENQAGLQTKIKTIREDKTLTDEQKKEQVKAVFKQQKEQFRSVLTPEQLQKMKSGRKGRGAETEK
jgi:Spy/CpxP family protein refolding chaperone